MNNSIFTSGSATYIDKGVFGLGRDLSKRLVTRMSGKNLYYSEFKNGKYSAPERIGKMTV